MDWGGEGERKCWGRGKVVEAGNEDAGRAGVDGGDG